MICRRKQHTHFNKKLEFLLINIIRITLKVKPVKHVLRIFSVYIVRSYSQILLLHHTLTRIYILLIFLINKYKLSPPLPHWIQEYEVLGEA